MSGFVRSAKNVFKGYSTVQVEVRNATANSDEEIQRDTLDELAEQSYNSAEFFDIMDMLDKRINDKGKYWRHVAKSLTVLDYLVRFGSENCVLWCKENLYIIKTLKEFRHEDEQGIDRGQIIRVKAKELTSLLMDEERLREERALNGKGRRQRRKDRRRDEEDEDMRRAIEASKDTAADEEERRRRAEQDRLAAAQLQKEEDELKRLQQQAALQQQQQLQAQQQQAMYYDIFGNPITPEEYMQYQQQQQQMALAQQQALLQQQQQQQLWAMQQQQALQQQQGLQSMETNTNNPFARNNYDSLKEAMNQQDAAAAAAAASAAAASTPQLQDNSPVKQKPLTQMRTGNKSISDKYSSLNTLLASGTGIDTFGNTGEQRIPAQHTKTGTFINSQGTGYKQYSDANTNGQNIFLNTQYTGLPSANIAPSYTGFGFGNQPQQQSNMNNTNLVDL
ncbi:epsin [Maudiozyma humilis]|uniref:Epsin n=1 Tax=Maudiozyma humilis TaxID=51915 RepID=A0AAV5RY25_MAUHU|nr:epsin [Kazachstania humilis]